MLRCQRVCTMSIQSTQGTAFQQPIPDAVFELPPAEGSTTVPETVGVSALAFVCTMVFGLIVSEKLTLPTKAESLIITIQAPGHLQFTWAPAKSTKLYIWILFP